MTNFKYSTICVKRQVEGVNDASSSLGVILPDGQSGNPQFELEATPLLKILSA